LGRECFRAWCPTEEEGIFLVLTVVVVVTQRLLLFAEKKFGQISMFGFGKTYHKIYT